MVVTVWDLHQAPAQHTTHLGAAGTLEVVSQGLLMMDSLPSQRLT